MKLNPNRILIANLRESFPSNALTLFLPSHSFLLLLCKPVLQVIYRSLRQQASQRDVSARVEFQSMNEWREIVQSFSSTSF